MVFSMDVDVRALIRQLALIALLGLVGIGTLGGCGATPPPAPPPSAAMLPPPPPAPGDPAAPGAPYLALVASRLAPEWRHFLDDCRTRLPAEHPLNQLQLEARAALSVDRAGALVSLQLTTSGNEDFDTAVREVVTAVMPLPAPPAWLLSDDDQLHLTWGFARDARQASAASAQLVWVEEPAPQVVERRLAAGDLAGAARRVARLGDEDPELRPQARRVFLAAISEGLGGEGQVRRAAVEAVRRARLSALAPRLLPMVADADPALRVQALAALASLGDASHAPLLLEQLAATRDAALATTLARALVAMAPAVPPEQVVSAVTRLAAGDREAQLTAMAALGELQVSPALTTWITRWAGSRDPALRAAVCPAVARAKLPAATRWQILGRGLDDRDGSARAACTAALAQVEQRPQPWMRTALRQRVDDKDQRVRAAAVQALMRWEPMFLDGRLRALSADPDPAIRAATVASLLRRGATEALRELLGDADAGVRRAAALALVPSEGPAVRERVMRDADPRVRLVALEVRVDQGVAVKGLADDPDPEVRAEVEVLHVAGHGESLQSGLVRMSTADAATLARVRIAMAWLLAT